MESDDITGKVDQAAIEISSIAWNVHRVNCGNPTGNRDSEEFLDDKAVMLEELARVASV